MAEYRSNSHMSKEQGENAQKERKMQKVVSGKVTTRENKGRKFMSNFIAEDAGNVGNTVVNDVVVPAIKKLISEGIATVVDMFLFGETRIHKNKNGNKVSYRSYYEDRYGNGNSESRGVRTTGNRFDYDDILFDDRGEAELVLDNMRDALREYGLISIADMYDMAGLTPPPTSNRYGWTSLRNAEVKRVRGGDYIIELPKAMPID